MRPGPFTYSHALRFTQIDKKYYVKMVSQHLKLTSKKYVVSNIIPVDVLYTSIITDNASPVKQ